MNNRVESLLKTKDKITNDYNNKIEILDKYIRVASEEIKDTDSLETRVFKLYMILDSVAKVANEINKQGYRIPTNSYIGERKYISNDITKIITNKNVDIEIDLKESVQEIQVYNYGKASKRWF